MSKRLARIERRTARNNLLKKVLTILFALISLGIIYKFGVDTHSKLIKLNRQVEMVNYGTVEDKLAAKAVVINSEEVAYASVAGRFENMVKDQEKVGRQSLLGYYLSSQGKIQVRAIKAGIFMLATDGLEEVFAQLDFASLTPEVFKYKALNYGRGQNLEIGQPVYKLVDNLVPTRLLVHFPQDAADFSIKANQKVNIIMAGREIGPASIREVKQESGETILLLEFTDFREQYLGLRFVEIEVLFNTLTGFLVPEKAVIEHEGKKGIYCLNGEDITFRPVQILGQKDRTLIVDGLNKNDWIVTNP